MTMQEFHTRRRMWAATNHGVLIAAEGDPRTHIEWLSGHFGSEAALKFFPQTTRGYVLDGRLVAYRPSNGDDFSRWVDKAEVLKALDEFAKLGVEIHTVGLGVRASGTEQPWPTVAEASADKFRLSESRHKDGK